MTDTPIDSNVSHPPSSWSKRILILAVAAILFLTLYPFWFDFHRHLLRPLFPFSLGGWGKGVGPFDDFLNVLLFVPFGFGLAEKFQELGKSKLATLAYALAAGAFLSYTVELLQIYIPQRDSGWEDVLTNSSGAVVGAALFDLFGGTALHLVSAADCKAGAWLTGRRAIPVLLLYVGCWCAIAARLQTESRLSNWDRDSLLVIGNSASNRFSSAWTGQVFAIEMWDRAVPPEVARRLTSQGPSDAPDHESIVAYRFSGSGPFQDEHHLLPDLSWTPQVPVSTRQDGAVLDGNAWLSSRGAVPVLVNNLKKRSRFSLRLLCEPAEISGVDARIVSISSPSGGPDLELRQEDTNLAFWFRTPLSMQRGRMSWTIPETFAANERRDILLSFDGANLSLFIDGDKHSGTYELGPGAALAKYIRRIKTQELEGYEYIFYTLIFFPAGCLVGLAWRTVTSNWICQLTLLLLALLLSSVIFEVLLVYVSGRAVSLEDISLSIWLAACGGFWINADRTPTVRTQVRTS